MSAFETAHLDPGTPNIARIYDYYLGGAFNLPADRDRADRIKSVLPGMEMLARFNRGFLRRSVAFMVDQGITQFLDLGSGLPTAGNTHEVAQARDPRAKVVYVDYEPVAAALGAEILRDNPDAVMVEGDARRPDELFADPRVTAVLDLDRPLGVVMTGVMVFVGDHEDPVGLMKAYRDACAPGSYIALSQLTDECADPETKVQVHAMVEAYKGVIEQLYVRDRAGVEALFDGMTLVEPGVTLMPDWNPRPGLDIPTLSPAHGLGYAAVGRVD
ncbi:SAM-dependent methyltransferase [Actinosynnema sp. NPDC023658]|uniref:SAM-dependent methyltransferase n=1 Tax=Actinosynnema sp. NPDC023658 TaxID=3155465 RepID=UPI0033FA36A5